MKALKILVTMMVLSPITSHAIPIEWTMTGDWGGVSEPKGTTFIFDADTHIFSGVALETPAGESVSSLFGVAGAFFAIGDIYGDYLVFLPDSPLTNAGGVIHFNWASDYSGNGSIDAFGRGHLSAVGVPEPGTLGLLGASLVGFGLVRRRRKA